MGRTACTEPQCLYKGALYLFYLDSGAVCNFSEKQWKCFMRMQKQIIPKTKGKSFHFKWPVTKPDGTTCTLFEREPCLWKNLCCLFLCLYSMCFFYCCVQLPATRVAYCIVYCFIYFLVLCCVLATDGWLLCPFQVNPTFAHFFGLKISRRYSSTKTR